MGAIVAGKKAGRECPDEITIADLTGLGIQDAAVATFVAEKAARRGLGRTIEV
jgi:ornithine cyclodeaminase/alanine dehydrogenase-like protein (mu-crystallin family)